MYLLKLANVWPDKIKGRNASFYLCLYYYFKLHMELCDHQSLNLDWSRQLWYQY